MTIFFGVSMCNTYPFYTVDCIGVYVSVCVDVVHVSMNVC